jgi:hypothetical protein
VDVLNAIYQWSTLSRKDVLESTHKGISSVFWLSGLAGTGKTTIARTVSERWQRENLLGASFFCSRNDAECCSTKKIIPTIAYHLGLSYDGFEASVLESLKRDPLALDADIQTQMTKLIIEPLSNLSTLCPEYIVVLDALDECEDRGLTSLFLSTLVRNIEQLSPLRFFITGRPEQHLLGHLSNRSSTDNVVSQLHLQRVSPDISQSDIRLYITQSLLDIKFNSGYSLPDDCPGKEQITKLVAASQGLFIYASMAIKFVGDPDYSAPEERLKLLVTEDSFASSSPRLLDCLYEQILKSAFSCTADLASRMKMLIGTILLLRELLTLTDLAALLQLPWRTIYNSLSRMRSVIDVPIEIPGAQSANTTTMTIRVVHPAFTEYLLSSNVAKPITIDSSAYHAHLLSCCFKAISDGQTQAISELNPPLSDVFKQQPELYHMWDDLLLESMRRIPSHVQYACRYWLQHFVLLLLEEGSEDYDILWTEIEDFSVKRKLYWSAVCRTLGIAKDIEGQVNQTLTGQFWGHVSWRNKRFTTAISKSLRNPFDFGEQPFTDISGLLQTMMFALSKNGMPPAEITPISSVSTPFPSWMHSTTAASDGNSFFLTIEPCAAWTSFEETKRKAELLEELGWKPRRSAANSHSILPSLATSATTTA